MNKFRGFSRNLVMPPAHLVAGAGISGFLGFILQRAGVSIHPGSAELAGAWLGPLVGTFVGLLAVAGTRLACTTRKGTSMESASWAATICSIYLALGLIALDVAGATT